MAKKQISNYKFFPGVIPPAFDQYPNAVALINLNKNYIVSEIMGYMQHAYNTPSYSLNPGVAAPHAISLLTSNKEFIKEEANAYVLSQIAAGVSPFGYNSTTCKRDLDYILTGVAYDVSLGTNYNAVFLGHAESNSLDFSEAVASIINQSRDQAKSLAAVTSSASAIAAIDSDYATINSIAAGGVAPSITFTNPSTATTSQIAAKNRLIANKAFIQAEVNAWVASNYPSYNHNVAKCTRDIGYAIDAACYDILYGGNSASYDQAKFFFYAVANGSPGIDPTHKDQTVGAYTRFKNIISDILTGTAVTKTSTGSMPNTLPQDTSGNSAVPADISTVVGLIQITIDVVSAATQAAANTALSAYTKAYPSIAWASTELKNATNAILANKLTIENTVASTYEYDSIKQEKCKRDIGYLIDAFITDLQGGGNAETIRISRMFFLGGQAQLISPVQEAAVHTFVRTLICNYVLPKVAFTSTQSPTVSAQVLTGVASESYAITKLYDLNTIVINLINNGLSSLPTTTYNFNPTFARYVYGATKCKRDIAYVLNAVAYDIALQTNYNAVFVGLAEKNSLDIDQTVINAITASKTQVLALSAVAASSTAIATVNSDYSTILSVAQGGTPGAITFTNPTGQTTSLIAIKDRLIANKAFIQAEINAWVGVTYPTHNHDEAKCSRDVGYAIDAFCYDMLYGGNSATYDNAKFFFYSGASGISAEHKAQTVAAYGRLKTIIGQIVQGQTVTKTTTGTTPNTLTQDTSGNNASAGDTTTLQSLAQVITDVVNNGVSSLPATRNVPSVTWADTGLKNAKSAIESASTTIQNTVVTYSDYTYDAAKCERDSTYVVDSYLYDMTYGGNSMSYYVGSRYQINNVVQVVNPEVEIVTQTFARDLINNYILQNKYHPSYQMDEYQVVDFAYTSEQNSTTAVTTLSNIILNTIANGLAALPDPVAPDSQGGTLLPNAVSLLERNKRFIQEEAIAYIQYNIDNNIAPYVFYTYNADKCRRDVSYVLEGYISDLSHGGNRETHFNASRYWVNNVAQVDGDRLPEIYAHTFIKDLIENFIWTNTPYTPKQILVSQEIDNTLSTESFAHTRLKELSNTILDVIKDGVTLLPTKVSNRGYLKIPGFYKLKDILLITNASRNQIMYNFADPSVSAEITYTEDYDNDFPGALYGSDKVTTLTFDIDTSGMMVTDSIQIFVEGKEVEVKMNRAASDAMERVKVGLPQSMLDADFEYGLQPTKWQALSLMRNYPSIYEIPSSDIPVTNVITDASTGTGGSGGSLITVTTQNVHGLAVGDPITIKALANTILGFSRAEGSFLVASVPTTSTFTYYAKSKVGTSAGQILASTYTQLRKGGFYTGSAIGSPSFAVYSAGNNGTVTTALITQAGKDVIGFTGSPPPIGSPLVGSSLSSGTQVTAVTGSGGVAASTQLVTNAAIGATDIVVASTTGISPGLVFDRGDGVAVSVTNVVGNTISLGSGLTSKIIGTSENYSNLTQTSTSGSGTSAIFTVSRSGSTYTTTVNTAGINYIAGDTITISGANVGGTAPTNNVTITVVTASPVNAVSALNNSTLVGGSGYTNTTGAATTAATGSGLTLNTTTTNGVITGVSINNPGAGYSPGTTVTINSVIGRALSISATYPTGSGYTTATNVAVVGGTGTGLRVNIVANSVGSVSSISLTSPGTSSYVSGPTTTTNIIGSGTGLNITIIADAGTGQVQQITNINNGGSGYALYDTVYITGGTGDATAFIQSVTNGEVTSIQINAPGSGYAVNDTIIVSGGGANAVFTVTSVSTPASIQIQSVTQGGAIQSVSTSGTPIVAPTKQFYSAFTISEPTTALIPSGDTGITYSAIATIQVTFAGAHGFIPGDTITVSISSTGTGAQLAAGPYFVEQVPDANTIRYTARAAGAIDNTLVGQIYARPDCFFIHRPFDGGVQLGTASPSHGAAAIRMSKKYIRYQSGKGVMYNTGALFAPSYDIRSLSASGTAVGSVITVITDDTDHGCQIGGVISINGAITSGYNGTYTVVDVVNERQLSVIANKVLGATTAELSSPCQLSIRNWHGATIRAGIFDDQNGMFWQYDGIRMAVVRRSSTFQLAGTIAIAANSNLVIGNNTRFRDQLAAGDRVVIRGMTHVVSQVVDETTMYVTPDFRGVKDVTEAKIVKTVDTIVPQEDWNLDPLNGAGPSGYNIDVTKMQMIGLQHTWYGAGFIDFMLRGPEGNYTWAHRFRNSNVNTEAYMRTGNQPVRYEVINEGATDKLREDITASQTTLPLTNAYWFPNSGTVIIDSELIRFTGNTGSELTGCTRAANLTQFVAGSQRNFTGSPATSHVANSGVILISNTITPNISHWGSAFMIDGQFDSDRGYIFNYAATAVQASTEKNTAFLIRLAPSVSNAQTGDLGEKELLNRAQLLLSSISITSDGTTGGATPTTITGGIVVEGVLNPSNYPTDPTKITWTGLQSAAQGGQPSFAQVAAGGSVSWGAAIVTTQATVQGAFTTTLTAKSFSTVNNSLTATSFSSVTQTLTLYANISGNFSALSSGRNLIFITTADYDALTTSLAVGDSLSSPSAGAFAANTTITAITRAAVTSGGTSYTQITMSSSASSSSGGGIPTVTCTVTSSLATRYNTAISNARTDFLVPNTQITGVSTSDLLSAVTYITGGQTISAITSNYCKISNVTYARIVMTSFANSTSLAGTGNNVTVTATVAATATYNRALSTGRTDFLVTNTQFASSGIATSDILSATTYITGGQTISSITQSYITISGVAYTRIVMSGVPNANSTAGTGNDVTVTITAAGSAASYANKNYLFFTSASWLASNATFGTKVDTTVTQFPAGTAVSAISTRTFGATTVYRVTFNQTATTTINASDAITFAFGANYALPGEQVFSFIANPGDTAELSLEALKELTATALGGRGTFPNGPDVLAINVYKASGTATPCNIILRWGEAQA